MSKQSSEQTSSPSSPWLQQDPPKSLSCARFTMLLSFWPWSWKNTANAWYPLHSVGSCLSIKSNVLGYFYWIRILCAYNTHSCQNFVTDTSAETKSLEISSVNLLSKLNKKFLRYFDPINIIVIIKNTSGWRFDILAKTNLCTSCV